MIIFVTSNADLANNNENYGFLTEPFYKGVEDDLNERILMEPFKVIKCFKELNENVFEKENDKKGIKADILCTQNDLVDTVTAHYDKNCILLYDDLALISPHIETLRKRPCFIHLHVEIPLSMMISMEHLAAFEIMDFIAKKEEMFKTFAAVYKDPSLHVTIESAGAAFDDAMKTSYTEQLVQIPIFNYVNLLTKQGISSPQRPSWDEYFMQLANLASSRSNCMKRKVGCCIVSKNKVIATGYNGTPRNLKNCFSGGCKRCNITTASASYISTSNCKDDALANEIQRININDKSSVKNVHTLGTCFCLHAEENALLEAGNIRIDSNCVLYCDTCPCITCSVKIVQAGIGEVVYSQSYNMDSESFAIFEEAGIRIRQFSHGGVERNYSFDLRQKKD